MHSITSHHPLESFEISGILIPAKGIIVIVGPNSSGKSLLLKDIELFIRLGRDHKPLVATDHKQRLPIHIDQLLEEIVREEIGQLPPNSKEISLTFTFAGQAVKNNFGLNINGVKNEVSNATQTGKKESVQLVNSMLSFCLMTVLDINARRSACDHVERIAVNAPCQSDMHALFKNRVVQERLEKITEDVLEMAVWLEYVSSNHFKLLIAPPELKPSLPDRHDPRIADNYRKLVEEGDGYKSFVGMVMSLLLGKRPLTLIDEPELWLHPPQAYEIGRLIGQEFGRGENTVLVATHSSHLLRGLLDTGIHNVTVVRMRRQHEINVHPFSARKVDSHRLVSLLQKPITAAESVLDGFFSKGVTIVESEGDRLVYQAASMGIDGFLRDVHFLTTGGNEAIPEAAKLYIELGQSTAAIVDLDTLINLPLSKKLFEVFVTDETARSQLVTLTRTIATENEKLPPTEDVATIAEAVREAAKLLDGQTTWGTDLDKQIVSTLDKLSERVKRTRRMKRGGISAYDGHSALQGMIQQAIDECAKYGLFFVPVGELEFWLNGKVSTSKQKKSKWAAETAQYIRSIAPPPSDDVWAFMRKVALYFNPSRSG